MMDVGGSLGFTVSVERILKIHKGGYIPAAGLAPTASPAVAASVEPEPRPVKHIDQMTLDDYRRNVRKMFGEYSIRSSA